MPFISKTRLLELEQAKTLLERKDDSEEDIRKQHAREIRSIQRNHHHEFEDLIQDQYDELKDLRVEHNSEIKDLEERVDAAEDKAAKATKKAQKEANEKLEAAKELADKENAKRTRELDKRDDELQSLSDQLDERDARLDDREYAVKQQQTELDAAVKKHAREVVEARNEGVEIGEKRGYANGIADGIRAIGQETKEARDSVMELANKAQDALVGAVTKEVPAPQVNVLTVGRENVNTNKK
jgi:chromosome segregation ATPase